MRYLGADFYLGLMELSATFDVLLVTTKVYYLNFYFLFMPKSVTYIFVVCLCQKNLLAFLAEILA